MNSQSRTEERREQRFRTCGLIVDVERWELLDARGERVEIAPLAFRLLAYLIDRRQRVVPKQEIFDALWGDVAVTEGSLTQVVWTLRRVLGDDGTSALQNVRGRGYRWAADVEPLTAEASERAPIQSIVVPRIAPGSASGRQSELTRLQQAADDALSGRGRAVLISGGPGIGKTWLAGEVATYAMSRGALRCEGRCYEEQGAPPMWSLRLVALAIVRGLQDVATDLGDDLAGDLCTLAPELEAFLPAPSHLPLRTPSEQRFFVWSALVQLLERASRRQPLIVVLEDLHWADEPTLLFLQRLGPELSRMPVLVACTYREDGPASLPHTVAALSRESGTLLLPLRGVPAPVVRALLLEHGVPDPSDALIERALALSHGNPLFVTQLARWLALEPAAARADAAALVLPEASRAVLRRQVAALPEETRACLRFAAALGDDFHLGELQRVTELPGEILLKRLEPAHAARLLARDDERAWVCRFGHPSMRSAIYDDMSEAQRARAHLSIAQSLAPASADASSARLNAIAYHYHGGAALGGAEQAVRFGLLAAAESLRATAYEGAIACCRRVLDVLPLCEPGDERARFDAQLLLGHALRLGTNAVEPVREAYAQAAATALDAGEPELHAQAAMSFAGRAPMRIQVLREAGTLDAREIALLERSLSLLPERDSPTRALVQGWLAYSLYNAAQSDRKAQLAAESVAMARRTGDVPALVECLMLSQLAVRGPDALHARIATLREAARLAVETGLRAFQLDAVDELAWSLFEAGDTAEAETHMHSVLRLAEEMGRPHDRRREARFRVMILDAAGRFDDAEALLRSGRSQTAWPPEHIDQGDAIRNFMLAYLRGRCAEIIGPLETLAKQFPLPVGWHCGLASTYAIAGRSADALRELRRLAASDFAAIPDDHNRVSSYVLLALTAHVLGEVDTAARLRDKLEPYGERNVLNGLRGWYGGPVWRTLGQLDTLLGDYPRAAQRLDLALERDLALGSAIGEAQDRLARAELLLARGERGDRARAVEQVELTQRLMRGTDLSYLTDWIARLRVLLAQQS